MAVKSGMPQSEVYIPACNPLKNEYEPHLLSDALGEYIHREFSNLHSPYGHLYMVPCSFSRSGDPTKEQAENAEELVYKRLQACSLSGVVFHGRAYLKKRDDGLGMTFKEHDFVFLDSMGKVCLLEVKSSADHLTEGVLSLSRGKSIADSRRSAMHQLQAHTKFLHEEYCVKQEVFVQCILWPFLSRYNQVKQERFGSDIELKHAFMDTLQDQDSFNTWMLTIMNDATPLDRPTWTELLKWFILLSCGVALSKIENLQSKLCIILSQEQLHTVSLEPTGANKLLVIDGPAGTGKSLLVLLKLDELWKEGFLGQDSQALVLCGRRCGGMEHYIKKFLYEKGVEQVTVKCLPDSHEPFQAWCEEKREVYKYVFVDAAEDFSWYGNYSKNVEFLKLVVQNTPRSIVWLLTDGNQVVYNLAIERGPIPGEAIFADVKLTNVYRTTGNIFSFIERSRQIEDDVPSKAIPHSQIHLGHSVEGPFVSYLNLVHFSCREEGVCALLADLCGKRGIKPNDISILVSGGIPPFNTSALNKGLQLLHGGRGFIPQGIVGAKRFFSKNKEESFYVGMPSDYKGLEALVVIAVVPAQPFVHPRMVRKCLYSMSSRCRGFFCLLWEDGSMATVVKKSDLKEYHIDSSNCTHFREHFLKLQQEKDSLLQSQKHEEERLKSFHGKLSEMCPVSAKELAKDGFIFQGRSGSDHVMCVFCGGVLYDWKREDTVRGAHQELYPSCPFIRGEEVGNIIISEETN
jgi:hypothetical protein